MSARRITDIDSPFMAKRISRYLSQLSELYHSAGRMEACRCVSELRLSIDLGYITVKVGRKAKKGGA